MVELIHIIMECILDKSPTSFYDSSFLSGDSADILFNELNSLDLWRYNSVFDDSYKLNRETVTFINKEATDAADSYPHIWGNNVSLVPWTPNLLKVKEMIESRVSNVTNEVWEYNIALGNRYKRSKDYIAFHCDNEEIGPTQSIASLSLGVTREFTFKPKEPIQGGATIKLKLEHGSLLFMGVGCQENYLHGMRKENLSHNNSDEILAKFDKTRINVTFRIKANDV